MTSGVTITGMPQLKSRFEAIKPNIELTRELGLSAVAEQKKLAAVATGNMRRTIGIGSLTATVVETVVTAAYAIFVELGTKAHIIVPRVKKVLRFAVGANRTLSGRPRSGGRPIYARRVKHPGTRAQPFMLPGAQTAVRNLGFRDRLIKRWNSAA